MKSSEHPYLQQGQRIRAIRKELRLSQKAMAKDLNVQPGTLSDIERGRRNMSRAIENKLIGLFNIAPKYLINGTLPMFDEGITLPTLQEPPGGYSPDEESKKITELEKEIRRLQTELLHAKDEIIQLLKALNTKK